MGYRSSIPRGADFLSKSQRQILENFSKLETIFSVEHSSLLPASATGKHKKTTLPELSTDETTLVDEGAIYTKEHSLGTALYFREENDGDVLQLTTQNYLFTFIKAFGVFTSTGSIVSNSAYNLSTAAKSGDGDDTYTLSFINPLSDTVTDTDYTVLITPIGSTTVIPTCSVKARYHNYFEIMIGNRAAGQSYGFSVIVLRI